MLPPRALFTVDSFPLDGQSFSELVGGRTSLQNSCLKKGLTLIPTLSLKDSVFPSYIRIDKDKEIKATVKNKE